jgi:hypothetical protein
VSGAVEETSVVGSSVGAAQRSDRPVAVVPGRVRWSVLVRVSVSVPAADRVSAAAGVVDPVGVVVLISIASSGSRSLGTDGTGRRIRSRTAARPGRPFVRVGGALRVDRAFRVGRVVGSGGTERLDVGRRSAVSGVDRHL